MTTAVLENEKATGPAETGALEYTGAGDWPAWFAGEQARAWDAYLAAPVPTRTDETWRFSNVKQIALDGFRQAGGVTDPDSLLERSGGTEKAAARVVFGNESLLLSEAPALPDGVILKPLEQAAREDEDLFRSYFMRQEVELGSHKYALLHRALLRTGVLLYVPADVSVELPVELFHWVEGENAAVFPHTLIICGRNSRVTVLDHYHSADAGRHFACGINDLHLEEGARLDYVAVQDWSQPSLAFHLNSTIVAANASATALNINFGARFLRGESLSRLTGEGARSIMLSLNPLDGGREIDQRTLQDHAAPGAFSDLLYHNTLDDKARSIFSGLIRVGEGAHRTDAYQKVRNLLLSDDAEANSMPGLEILADDVRCSHGATSAEISGDELFYMRARGIPAAAARRLIVMGFFNSLLERLEEPSLRARLSELVRARLL